MNVPDWHGLRSPVLFVTGLAGIVYTTVAHSIDRPTLLILFGAMVGLPMFLRLDEQNRNGDKK